MYSSKQLTTLRALLDLFHTMYQALIAACLLLTVAEAGQRQENFRHAKATTVLIVGSDEASHSLSLGSGSSWMPAALVVTNAHVIEELTSPL
jgi:hypothetical protein